MLTICTPTFNRAYCLSDLYKSLKTQTERNFEWIIVDDGSKDHTDTLVAEWVEEASIPIRYIYKENGGKHTALNYGIDVAKGDYFIIVDSDDMLTADAVATIRDACEELPQVGFAGVGFNKQFLNGDLIGGTFEGQTVDASTLERAKYHIVGDKAEVFRTEILKKYPFPVFEGERFLTEAVVWNRIAADGYKIRWYNKGVYLCQYREDGLSMNASCKKNFQGYTLAVKEIASYKTMPLSERIRNIGVYACVAEELELSTKKTAELIYSSWQLVAISKSLYKLKRLLLSNDRRKKLRV